MGENNSQGALKTFDSSVLRPLPEDLNDWGGLAQRSKDTHLDPIFAQSAVVACPQRLKMFQLLNTWVRFQVLRVSSWNVLQADATCYREIGSASAASRRWCGSARCPNTFASETFKKTLHKGKKPRPNVLMPP